MFLHDFRIEKSIINLQGIFNSETESVIVTFSNYITYPLYLKYLMSFLAPNRNELLS